MLAIWSTAWKILNPNSPHPMIPSQESPKKTLEEIAEILWITDLDLCRDTFTCNLPINSKLSNIIVIMRPKMEDGHWNIPTLEVPSLSIPEMRFLKNFSKIPTISSLVNINLVKNKLQKQDYSVFQTIKIMAYPFNILPPKMKIYFKLCMTKIKIKNK